MKTASALKFASVALALLALLASPQAPALELVPLTTFGTNGDGTIRPGDLPFLTGDGSRFQRGMAYNPTTDHLIIVNRNPVGSETINVIDGFTGASVGELDQSQKTLGGSSSFAYNLVGVAEDGAIYVCNLTTSGTLVEFILYRWASESSLQERVYGPANPGNTTSGNSRWGDTLAVRGSGINTEVLIANRGTLAAMLKPTDSSMATFAATTLQTDVPAGGLGFGLAFGTSNTFYGKEASSEGNPLYYLSYDLSAGTAATLYVYSTAQFPGRIAPLGTLMSSNWLAGIDMNPGTNADLVRLYDISSPVSPPVFLDRKVVDVWTNANNIFAGAVAFGSSNLYALDSDNGLVAFTITNSTSALAPLIFGDPSSRVTQITSNTVFTVGADGTEPLSYQWLLNGTELADATDASLSLTNVATTNGGSYTVIVTNDHGAVTSAVAVLTVLANFGDLLIYDPFAYAVGTMLPGQGGWTMTSAEANGAIEVGNLAVPGLALSAGDRYTWTNSSSVRKPFGQYSSGEVYCSFAFRVDSAITGTGNETTAGFSFGTSTVFPLKINIIGTGAGGYQLAVYKGGGTTDGAIAANVFAQGETVFVVARYVFNTNSTSDDTCDLWLNPDPSTFGSTNVPTPAVASIGAGKSETWTFIDRFFWRWSSTGSGYAKRVADELRVGFSWAEVTPPAPPVLSVALSGMDAVVSWPANNSEGYVLQGNPKVEDSGGWEAVGTPVVVQGENYTVTIPATGAQFFRLQK